MNETKRLTASYTHPLCGCTEWRTFTVEIDGADPWPKLSCSICGCRLTTSNVVVHLGGMIGDTA